MVEGKDDLPEDKQQKGANKEEEALTIIKWLLWFIYSSGKVIIMESAFLLLQGMV